MRDIDVTAASDEELLAVARQQLDAWTRAARALLPADAERIDAHCHIGLDSDGSAVSPQELLAQLDQAGVRHAACAPLHQVDGYGEENRIVRERCAASGGRLHALHRCSPEVADPAADAERGLSEGAVGLKWHPRAERFSMADPVAQRTAAVADEAGVPILIHAGRGMERLGEGVVQLARRHERATFILAHAAVSDLAWIVDATRDVPNVVFDTSWWRPTDIAVLLTSAPPARVLFGSDPPYGTVELGLQITARLARACGWDDAAMFALMGGTARRVYGLDDGAGEQDLSAAPLQAHMPEEVPAFRRCAELLATAMQIELAEGSSAETFDLALAALDVLTHDPHADAAGLLRQSLLVGRALMERAALPRDGGGPAASPSGVRLGLPQRRAGIALLMSTLVHLATPALPIHGIDAVG